MKARFIVLSLAIAATARGDQQTIDPVAAATPQVVDALTGVDFPNAAGEIDAQRASLDALLGTDPVSSLAAIADADAQIPSGVRIRALRALALYDTDPARAALRTAIAKHGASTSGIDLLELRAAIEGLGLIGDATDVATIVPFLDKEESRDIRSAAARALRDIGSTTAIAPLHARLTKEKVAQVQFWISDALRVLSVTPS
ncbi:MAG TPA: HEAT repeat domain-containing protein [Kofleriaceae bacterium]|nr:HEAT repeat domain-containing protein [Kofleriaceae bacterium]